MKYTSPFSVNAFSQIGGRGPSGSSRSSATSSGESGWPESAPWGPEPPDFVVLVLPLGVSGLLPETREDIGEKTALVVMRRLRKYKGMSSSLANSSHNSCS